MPGPRVPLGTNSAPLLSCNQSSGSLPALTESEQDQTMKRLILIVTTITLLLPLAAGGRAEPESIPVPESGSESGPESGTGAAIVAAWSRAFAIRRI